MLREAKSRARGWFTAVPLLVIAVLICLHAAVRVGASADVAQTGDLLRAATFLAMALSGVLLYLLPSAVAALRRHRDRGALLALNLLAGWTGLGWLIALVWSLTGSGEA